MTWAAMWNGLATFPGRVFDYTTLANVGMDGKLGAVSFKHDSAGSAIANVSMERRQARSPVRCWR